MKQVLDYLGVKEASELCSYVYNHGNNPYCEIYAKKDIRIENCGVGQWINQDGYRYCVVAGAKAILNESEDYHNICDSLGIDFYKLMQFASTLDDAHTYAQLPEVKFLQPYESIM